MRLFKYLHIKVRDYFDYSYFINNIFEGKIKPLVEGLIVAAVGFVREGELGLAVGLDVSAFVGLGLALDKEGGTAPTKIAKQII